MIEFLLRRAVHLCFDRRVAGHGRMALVQALGGNFAGMVDPHQPSRVEPLGVGQRRLVDALGRTWPRPAGRLRIDRAERVIDPGNQAVERR